MSVKGKKVVIIALANFSFFAFALGPSSAVDPKFELDPRKLDEKLSAPPCA